MPTSESVDQPTILVTGGTGYIGGFLIARLEKQGVKLRCLARNPDKLRSRLQATAEVVPGDILDPLSLDRALQGVHTAYYLVHLMSGSKDFEREDRRATLNFAGSSGFITDQTLRSSLFTVSTENFSGSNLSPIHSIMSR